MRDIPKLKLAPTGAFLLGVLRDGSYIGIIVLSAIVQAIKNPHARGLEIYYEQFDYSRL